MRGLFNLSTFALLIFVIAPLGADETPTKKLLFDFADPASVRDWAPVKLLGLEREAPTAKIEIVPAVSAASDSASAGNCLKITFAGGDWPVIGTTRIPVSGNWQQYQTLKTDITVDRASVAYLRICQGQSNDKEEQPCWQRTLMLQPGRNEVTLLIRKGLNPINPAKGEITSFNIGMFQPAVGQTLMIDNVRLSTDWPAPNVLGWYSPYNHDGYSIAVAREYERTEKIASFKVLGTDIEVADLRELAAKFKESWTKPEAKTIEQVEADFQAEYVNLNQKHPRAVMAILRDGQQGWDSSNPNKVYAGWKTVYISSHGPDGPNRGREQTQQLGETVEAFMRHRSVIMRADLSSIPPGANILAAQFAVTRGSGSREPPEKPNLWVTEPCNRAWDEATANCYFYAPGKHWKAVNGLYYGADPDYWPVFLSHGPAGSGTVCVWDFTEALKFWQDDKHPNHGFFLHGDSIDYMRMNTSRAKELRDRPAILVIYEPK